MRKLRATLILMLILLGAGMARGQDYRFGNVTITGTLTNPGVALVGRSYTGTTDTIVSTDNFNTVQYKGASAVATALPTPTTLGNAGFFTILQNITSGSSTAVTVTPATWTVNGSATLAIAQGRACSFAVDQTTATNWLAICYDLPLTATSPLALTRSQFGSTISINANGIGAAQLAAQYSKGSCIFSMGDGVTAIASATYPASGAILQCPNNSGVTYTVTAVHCYADAGTPTINVSNNAGTSFLTGAITCTSTKTSGGQAGTQSGTTTLATTDGFNFVLVSGGTAKMVTAIVDFTY